MYVISEMPFNFQPCYSDCVTDLKPLHLGLHVVLCPQRLPLAFLDARVHLLRGALGVASAVGGAQMRLQLHRSQKASVHVSNEAADGAVHSLLSILRLRRHYCTQCRWNI